jgi:hypothetical protein
MISRLKACLALAGLLTFGSSVLASPVQTVIELFTSQGCSSCPPADAFMAELVRRPDIVALTLPVDYWDYLGWKDTLAHPLFTARQRAYAHARGDRQVFTPQMVLNGVKSCIGSDRAQIERSIAANAVRRPFPATVTTSERDGIVVIEVEGAADRMAEIWAMPVLRSQTVPIGRGENLGRTITYSNVVRGLVRVGEWQGGSARYETSLKAVKGDTDGYVVLLQTSEGTKPGVILGAAKSPGL